MDLETLQRQICKKYQSKYIEFNLSDRVAIALQSLGQQPIYAVRVALKNQTMFLGLFTVENILPLMIFINRCMPRIYSNIYLKFYLIWRLSTVIMSLLMSMAMKMFG